MIWQKALDTIVEKLETLPSVEGVFLSGSLVNEYKDEYSDIDLGVAVKNSNKAFTETYDLRHELVAAVGQPIHHLDRGWEHCKMIAALYSRSQFPPIGLEIDLIFSQLRFVSEQMPYSKYQVIFDRNGKLKPELAKIGRTKPNHEVENEIQSHLSWIPFFAHDALKACRRKDDYQLQSLLEEIRKLAFFAAAARQNEQMFGAKRAVHFLTGKERKIIQESYHHCDEGTVIQLVQIYFEGLNNFQLNVGLRDKIENARITLEELL